MAAKSKMAAKFKMATENYDFFFNTHSYVRLIRAFFGGNYISDSILLNKSMLKAQDGNQIQDGRDI